MMIGLTYDLRSEYLAAGYSEDDTAEFDRPDTIDAIESALQQLGHQTYRIGHAQQLVSRLAEGQRWDLVFNICEGLHGIGREAQVPAILDVYEIPYTFADPAVMSLCLHKELAKLVVRAAGLPTPRSLVIHDLDDVERSDLEWPVFAKPLAEGTGKGVTPASRVNNRGELTRVATELLAKFQQPVLAEEYLPGREFTVGLLGTGSAARVLGTLEIVLLPGAEPDAYSYVNKENCEALVEYRRIDPAEDDEVREAEMVALRAWRALGCRDGGRIDLRSNATGHPEFLEANPLAGLHPEHSDLPMLATAQRLAYVDLIEQILSSAVRRVTPARRPASLMA